MDHRFDECKPIKLQNHTYEIIAITNPFSITCHVVNIIGAFLVFVTLSLLCFTDIALRNTRCIVYQNLLLVIFTNLLVKEILSYILNIQTARNQDLTDLEYVPTEI